MLAKVLHMGGIPMEPDEEARAEQVAVDLMKIYHERNGTSEFEVCSKASHFDAFITTKYQ